MKLNLEFSRLGFDSFKSESEILGCNPNCNLNRNKDLDFQYNTIRNLNSYRVQFGSIWFNLAWVWVSSPIGLNFPTWMDCNLNRNLNNLNRNSIFPPLLIYTYIFGVKWGKKLLLLINQNSPLPLLLIWSLFLQTFRNWHDYSAKIANKSPIKFHQSMRKFLTSPTILGIGHSIRACIFHSIDLILSIPTMKPKNSTLLYKRLCFFKLM